MSAAADRVRQLLADLGDTPDQVADRLRAHGIKGIGSTGPIEAYIYQQITGVRGVRIGISQLTFRDIHGTEQRIQLPTAVVFFLARLDRGVYLDLEEVPS